jgi:DNA-binding NarL/FixJ family response regulator
MPLRILLVDDHAMLRQALGSLLDQEVDFEVVAQASDGRQALDQVRQEKPDVVVMDLTMPHLNGIEATRQIKAECPQVQIVALSQHTDRRFVVGMFQSGATGYVVKEEIFTELARAIRTVAAGQVYLSPPVAGMVVEGFVQQLNAEVPAGVLTPREREVLQLIVEGHTTPEIAQRLHLSARTVTTHRQHLMDKLDIHTALLHESEFYLSSVFDRIGLWFSDLQHPV